MDWTSLSNRLAEGEKTWRAFHDGAEVASQLASLERARNELQAQYDALPAQIQQAKDDLKAVQERTAQALADGAAQLTAQAKAASDAAARRVSALQSELDGWNAKIAAQQAAYDTEGAAQKEHLDTFKAQITQLQSQVDALTNIKSSLKSSLNAQLQEVS